MSTVNAPPGRRRRDGADRPGSSTGQPILTHVEGGSVELEGVSRLYGNQAAVQHLDLSMPPGEFLAVLGPSGAGKTTVLGLVAGFVEPTAGSIRIGGEDVTRVPPHRRNIGVVFQHYALFPHLDVLGNVEFPLRARRVPSAERRERARAALRLVGLVDMEGRRASTLSGGQQQRVALARALVFQPRVLLLDEPLAALDRQLREQMRTEIRNLQRRTGATTILVTHDQDEALSMADRVLLMRHGRPEQVGTPRELYERPATRFAADFVGTGSLLAARTTSDGRAAQTAGGAVLGLAPDACGHADHAGWVVLRPEAMDVVDAEDGLPVTITDLVYSGPRCTVHASAEDATPIMVEAPASTALRPGDRVGLRPHPPGPWFIPAALPDPLTHP